MFVFSHQNTLFVLNIYANESYLHRSHLCYWAKLERRSLISIHNAGEIICGKQVTEKTPKTLLYSIYITTTWTLTVIECVFKGLAFWL